MASEFEVGDLVKFSRVFRITDINDETVSGTDAKSGTSLLFRVNRDSEAIKLELVHRPRRKPQVGTVLTGQEVYDTPWKRGTILLTDRNQALVLREDGTWIREDGLRIGFKPFFEASRSYNYTLIYLPREA